MIAQRALALVDRCPHAFTLQYPPRREYFQEHFRADLDLTPLRQLRRVLLYVHVPFCESRCSYCNFAIDTRQNDTLHSQYVDGLCRQLERLEECLAPDVVIGGIDIGGGTPTILSPANLERLLRAFQPWIRRADHPIPLSIETTPSLAASDPDRLAILVAGGVSRISVGLQTMDDDLLSLVNRGSERLYARAIDNLRRADFERINVDLIFGLPGQTKEQWQHDLDRAIALPIDSITTYDCLYRGKGRLLQGQAIPAPEQYGELYDLAFERLTVWAGFLACYGSLNFSWISDETGPSAYFERRLLDGMPYLGLGNYASSLIGEQWWFAPYRVGDWLAAVEGGSVLPVGDSYHLPTAEVMAKYLLLSLSFGVIDPVRFRSRFDCALSDQFADALTYAIDRGWLFEHSGVFALKPGAFRYLPWLRALFYAPQAIEWLERCL
jgi:oxygen-independent coproporphyrinogen-3 oxidase